MDNGSVMLKTGRAFIIYYFIYKLNFTFLIHLRLPIKARKLLFY